MYMRGDRVVTWLELTISLLAALAVGWIAASTDGANSNSSRALVFAIVCVWLAMELVPIMTHIVRQRADGLTISMALSRLSIMSYFGAMALNMGGLVAVPIEYFTGSRIAMAMACGAAAAFLARETWWVFDDLTPIGRVVMVATLAALGVALWILIVTF